jgi:hypothetical protein
MTFDALLEGGDIIEDLKTNTLTAARSIPVQY